jgi:hypothetical protein
MQPSHPVVGHLEAPSFQVETLPPQASRKGKNYYGNAYRWSHPVFRNLVVLKIDGGRMVHSGEEHKREVMSGKSILLSYR